MVTPPDRADSRNQPEPIHDKDENENRGVEPKAFPHQVAADNVFKERVETLDHPLPKILSATWNWFEVAHRGLRKNDDTSSHNPSHQHRVCDPEAAELNERLRFERDALMLSRARFSCKGRRGKHCAGGQRQGRHQKTTITHLMISYLFLK